MAASYQASKIVVYDLETGQTVVNLDSGSTYGESSQTRRADFERCFVVLTHPREAYLADFLLAFCLDGTAKTQINQVVCHPTIPLVVSAHEDKYIKFYDANSGELCWRGASIASIQSLSMRVCGVCV